MLKDVKKYFFPLYEMLKDVKKYFFHHHNPAKCRNEILK
jgi:hypothetical protein